MIEIIESTRMLYCEGDTMTVGDLWDFLVRLGADRDDELIVSISPTANAFTIEGDKGE